jgi:hypothetical protein
MGKSGFRFEGSGRVHKTDVFRTKRNQEIVTVVVQVEGNYPQLVPIKFFGRTGAEAKKLQAGDAVEISGTLGGRDWNGKVYGDINGESFTVNESGARAAAPAAGPEDDDLPF